MDFKIYRVVLENRRCRTRCYCCCPRKKAGRYGVGRLCAMSGIGLSSACGGVIHTYFGVALIAPTCRVRFLAFKECFPIFLCFSLRFGCATCKHCCRKNYGN